MTSKAITPNQREGLSAQSTITGRQEYLSSTNNILNVNATFSASSISLQDGSNSSIKATVFDLTDSNPLATQIVDANGDAITSFGGGTQYTNGGVPPANPIGTAPIYNNGGTWATVSTTNRLPTSAAQSGTWNITNISGTVSLPTGAATAAKQPALGTAGSASTDVLTVQGIASMTALKVDGSAVTQPVSGAATGSAVPSTAFYMGVLSSSGNLQGIASAGNLNDGAASTNLLAAEGYVYNGSTHDRRRSIVNGTNSTGTGIAAAGLVAQFDDVSPTSITENQFGNLRISANRNLYGTIRDAAGNERGANVTASNALVVDGSAVTQPVSGTVTSNIGTTNGLALDATLTGGTQQTKLTDGSNAVGVLKSDGTTGSQNALMTTGSFLSVPFTTTTAQAVGSTDAGNYRWVSIHITTQGGSSTVTFQTSNDNTNWVSTALNFSTSVATVPTTSTTSAGVVFQGPLQARYFRLNVTGIVSGTTAGTIVFSALPTAMNVVGGQVTQSGTWTVGSNSATGSAVPANAFYKGLLAQTANPSAASAGNLVGALADKLGKQVVVGSIRDLKVNQITTITTSTAETTVLTAVASTFLDVYGAIVTNTSATAVTVAFKDSTGGTTQFNIAVPAGETRGFMLPESAAIKQGTVNNNWTATTQSVTSVIITMLAVKNI
jgi:hypothetical protein